MIQLIPRVHSKTIVGLITTLIIFAPLITSVPFTDRNSEFGDAFDDFLSREVAVNHSNNHIAIAFAPPKSNQDDEVSSPSNSRDLGNDLKTNSSIDQSIVEDGKRSSRRVEPPEMDTGPIQGSHFIPSVLKEMEQYEIRINPVVRQYNESAYKVALLATLVRKSGDEPPRKLPTVEGADLDNLFDTLIHDNNIGPELEKFEGRNLGLNISDDSRLTSEYPIDNLTSLNGTLSNDLQNTSVSVDYPSSTLESIIPTTVSVILENERETSSSPPVILNLESPNDLVKNAMNMTSSDSSKSERNEKTDLVISVPKSPSICDRKAETENSLPKPIVESSSVQPSTTTETPKPHKMTPSSISEKVDPISPSAVIISSTTPNPISSSTTNQPSNSTDKLDSTREYNSSIHKDHEMTNYLNLDVAKPAPETEWVPEGVRVGPAYFIANGVNHRDNYVEIGTNDRGVRNNQVKPSRMIEPSITRQNERSQYRDNQRQVVPLNHVPPPIASYNLPPPQPPSVPGRTNYNQESNQVPGTRNSNQYPAWNPVRNANQGVYYVSRPQQTPGRPIAIEEIVHTRGSRLNQQNRVEPELFMRIIRHYFVNAWVPREDRFVFERREPIIQPPQSRPSINQYQT